MNRRRFLAGLPVLGGAVGGCLGGPSCAEGEAWSPTVQADELEVAPGEVATVSIAARPISSFGFQGELYRCGADDAPVAFGEVDVSPDPDVHVDSCPPVRVWEDCKAVDVHAPVAVASDAEPGEYEYGFTVSERTGEHDSRTYEYAITVSED